MPPERRESVEQLSPGCWRVLLRYGFRDTPNIPVALGCIPDLQVTHSHSCIWTLLVSTQLALMNFHKIHIQVGRVIV